MSTHECPNCNNNFAGTFCNNCGQKEVHRITMHHLWHDLIHAFTHADKGFLYLMIQLFKKPGVVIREYILEGKRKRYFTPLQYLIIIGAFATFAIVNTHYFENTMNSMESYKEVQKMYTPQQQEFMRKITLMQSKYYNILLLLQLPFYALSAWIVYKKRKLNFAELLTVQTFITAQTTIMSVLLILSIAFMKANPNIVTGIMFVLTLSYQVATYMQFFKEYTFMGFLKAAASYLLGIIFFFLFAIIVGAIIGLVYALFLR